VFGVVVEEVVVEIIIARCAGLDVHKQTVMAAVRTPDDAGGRREQVRQFSTFTAGLRELREWLSGHGVTQVAMEATGVYWKPVWHMLADLNGVELLLCNAHHVKRVPGRKTDVSDAAWLAQLCEVGLLTGSFVPPPEIARLRDLTRYRKKLINERGRETQRIQKLLEDTGIKLDNVATDILGKSARAMLEALIDGERDPAVLAELARTRMRAKLPELQLALEGRFNDHHALMLRLHLDHVDHLSAMVDRLDEEVDRAVGPFLEPMRRLQTIPGVGKRTAEVMLAEMGADMTRFPTPQQLASWAGLCPSNNESGGKRRAGKARKGNAALRTAMCEAAWVASRTKGTYLSAQFRHLRRRFGKRGENKAIFAVAHTMLVVAWHLLAREVDYQDLGVDFFEHRNDAQRRQRYLIRELEKLGHTVVLDPAA
jgi:transposase